MRKLLHALGAPPSWRFNLTTIAVASFLFGCEAFSWHVGSFVGGMVAFLLVAIVLLWPLKLLLMPRSDQNLKRVWLGSMVYPTTLAVSYGLYHFEVPRRLAFRCSTSALDQLVQSVENTPKKAEFPGQRVGCFDAQGIRRTRNGLYFCVDQADVLDPRFLGYAYTRDGQLPVGIENQWMKNPNFERLDAHWFYTVSYEVPES